MCFLFHAVADFFFSEGFVFEGGWGGGERCLRVACAVCVCVFFSVPMFEGWDGCMMLLGFYVLWQFC